MDRECFHLGGLLLLQDWLAMHCTCMSICPSVGPSGSYGPLYSPFTELEPYTCGILSPFVLTSADQEMGICPLALIVTFGFLASQATSILKLSMRRKPRDSNIP